MEVELKFAIEPRDHGRLRRSRALAGAAPTREILDTTYFDTPDCELAGRDLALRLRHAGPRWIEGLKASQRGAGGLHVREEWEFERPDPGIDLARFAETPLAELPHARTLHRRLRPAFRVVMARTAWRVAPAPGAIVEVVLDHGRVESGRRGEPISEVEIECIEGGPQAAFDLAERLLDDVPLRASTVSKARRGYRLFRRELPAAAKAARVVLERGAGVPAAARRVVGAALAQLQANEEGVLGSPDPEYIHQARIALRRLRAALRMFRASVGDERAKAWRSRLGDTARRLGEARDWDVFATQTLPPALADCGDVGLARRLRGSVARRRAQARARARDALRSRGYSATVLALARWLAAAPGRDEAGKRAPEAFAAHILRRRHRRVLRDRGRIASLSSDERHRLRIAAKRLRYGADALASLFSQARVDAYADVLSELQDVLGAANDAATAQALLGCLRLPRRFEKLARARFAADAAADPEAVETLLARLDRLRPWR